MVKKTPELILVGEKISHLKKIGHFSLTKFYTSPLSRKDLSIPLKFYFKNGKLINGQVNWLMKINVNVQVFFFTATVSVTDRFWLISRHVKRMGSAKWIVDLYNTLKDYKEMAVNGFRNARITESIENARDMVEKVENPFKGVS